MLELKGALTLGPALGRVREAAKQILGNGKVSGMILVMTDVNVIDSSGLGELTVVYSMVAKKGCHVRLVDASSSLKKMLQMTRIDELLPLAADIAEAKAAMKCSGNAS